MKLLPAVYCWIKANNKLEKIWKEKQSYLLNELDKLTATIDLSRISIWWRHQKFRITFRKQILSRGVGNDLSSEIICFMERSSRLDVLCQKGVLRHFAKFTGKHLCQGLFFKKAAGLRMQFIKKRPWYRCFPVNFAEFLGAPFILEHLVKYSNGCSLQKLFNSTVMFRTNYLGECYGLCRI